MLVCNSLMYSSVLVIKTATWQWSMCFSLYSYTSIHPIFIHTLTLSGWAHTFQSMFSFNFYPPPPSRCTFLPLSFSLPLILATDCSPALTYSPPAHFLNNWALNGNYITGYNNTMEISRANSISNRVEPQAPLSLLLFISFLKQLYLNLR